MKVETLASGRVSYPRFQIEVWSYHPTAQPGYEYHTIFKQIGSKRIIDNLYDWLKIAVVKGYREHYARCILCGAEPGEPCVVINGNPEEDEYPGEIRFDPHFYRQKIKE